MALPGLVAAQNLADVTDRERAWDNLGLNVSADFFNLFDEDARAYIVAVQTADGQTLEPSVQFAINNFVVGCKADGIWSAIKASCILAGARTLNGALVPLLGAAPTNFNFISDDYNRKTGLVGNGSTKYLDSNRNNNADPQNSSHLAIYSAGAYPERNGFYYAGVGGISSGATHLRSITGSVRGIAKGVSKILVVASAPAIGMLGVSRSNSADTNLRGNGVTTTAANTSTTPISGSVSIFADSSNAAAGVTNARLAFYSIGESLDLALLDARVTALINAFAAAIP
jgi:hypothetical protein